MHQRMSIEYNLLAGKNSHPYEINPLKINVYTSGHCSFCNETLAIVHSVVDKLNYLEKPVEIVETNIEDKPHLVEEMDILALPIVQIGHLRIVGLPCTEDVEMLIHETILRGY